ncbi:AraC family transcriptional regulator [Bacillaceae bacterium SIJ1]|uniref:helix-turn-helix domain-containing protein n=1 Tax=Litoribacterium kuwaitense TaxID=1398745 RepID=UPI0013EDCF47|nr:AraC family transcriptional regulator [Litoribacterium kuwaitense]NGP44268.1 AraC family transcriptional regulator [Litoribacterium kuwaitense]
MLNSPLKRSFGFHFKETRANAFANITNIGWETQQSTSYYWDGEKRAEVKNVAFQYTLSGRGEILYNDKVYSLDAGQAFFVEFPSPHAYYLPEDSPAWEFLYITLQGEEAMFYQKQILEAEGPVLTLHPEHSPIQLLFSMWQMASENHIKDSFRASSLAYQFVTELYRHVLTLEKNATDWPLSIVQTTSFIHKHFAQDIALDDLVKVSQLSRYHFTRRFKQTTGMSPMQYVTKIRIEKAMALLSSTSLQTHSIAKKCGYPEANYFNKVFKKIVGTSPSLFRRQHRNRPIDVMFLE